MPADDPKQRPEQRDRVVAASAQSTSSEFGQDPPTEERTDITKKPGASATDSLSTPAPKEQFPALLVQSGPTLGDWYRFPREASEVCVGRGRECEFRIKDGSVSRRHALFRVLREGVVVRVFVEDLGSTNGTRVAAQKIREPTELEDGDMVAVGDIRLRFRMMDSQDAAFQEGLAKQVQNARKDALTGLMTRRYLDEHLPGLVDSHRRNQQPISLLLIDVDHFKSINDRYGHLAGDEVLWRVADSVRTTVRGADTAVRYGGEEFCVVLPGTAGDVAERVAERVRRNIQNLDLAEVRAGVQVTASVGVAALLEGEVVESWLHRADAALYAAKGTGRNRVCVAPRPSLRPPQFRPHDGATGSTTASRRRDDPIPINAESDPMRMRRKLTP